jgi:hypothetical protein
MFYGRSKGSWEDDELSGNWWRWLAILASDLMELLLKHYNQTPRWLNWAPGWASCPQLVLAGSPLQLCCPPAHSTWTLDPIQIRVFKHGSGFVVGARWPFEKARRGWLREAAREKGWGHGEDQECAMEEMSIAMEMESGSGRSEG